MNIHFTKLYVIVTVVSILYLRFSIFLLLLTSSTAYYLPMFLFLSTQSSRLVFFFLFFRQFVSNYERTWYNNHAIFQPRAKIKTIKEQRKRITIIHIGFQQSPLQTIEIGYIKNSTESVEKHTVYFLFFYFHFH